MQASLPLSAQLCTARPCLQRSLALRVQANAAPARPGGGASRASNPPPTSDARTNWGAAFEISSRPSGAARDIFQGLPASAAAPGFNTPDPSGARPSGAGRSVSMTPSDVRPASPMAGPERPGGGSSRGALFASSTAQEPSLGGGNGGSSINSSGGGGGSGNSGSGSFSEGPAAVYGLAYAAVCGAAVAAHNSIVAPKPAQAKACCGGAKAAPKRV